MYTTLYRIEDKQKLLLHGHFNKGEIGMLKKEGWRLEEPQVNKHGIPVEVKK